MAASPLDPFRPLAALGGLVLVVATLAWAQDVLIPAALAVLLSFALTPAVLWLQRFGLKRLPATLAVVAVAVVFVGGLLALVSYEVHALATELPKYKEDIAAKLKAVHGTKPGLVDRLTRMADEIGQGMAPTEDDDAPVPAAPTEGGAEKKPQPVVLRAERPTGFTLFAWMAGPLMRTLGKVGLVVGLTVSILLMREDLRNRLIRLAGPGRITGTTRSMEDASRRISKYLLIQVSLNAGFGSLYGLGLWLLGVPYALIWGVLAAALRFVPFIGTWLAAVLPLLVSVAQPGGWGLPASVVLLTLVLGVGLNNILEPMLVSRSTGLSPVALVAAAAFWTWLWGPVGLVLSTPITVCLSVVGRHFRPLKILDVLLSSAAPLGPRYAFYQRLLAGDEAEADDLLDDYLREHTWEQMADDVVLPALARARQDHDADELTDEELDRVVTAAGDLIADHAPDGRADGTAPVLGCPAGGRLDAAALALLRPAVADSGGRLELAGPGLVASEVVARVGESRPALVVVGATAPMALAPARYLCKRLKARFPDVPVVVARWGREHDAPKEDAALKASGADHVVGSLAEAVRVAVPLVRVAPHLAPKGDRVAPA